MRTVLVVLMTLLMSLNNQAQESFNNSVIVQVVGYASNIDDAYANWNSSAIAYATSPLGYRVIREVTESENTFSYEFEGTTHQIINMRTRYYLQKLPSDSVQFYTYVNGVLEASDNVVEDDFQPTIHLENFVGSNGLMSSIDFSVIDANGIDEQPVPFTYDLEVFDNLQLPLGYYTNVSGQFTLNFSPPINTNGLVLYFNVTAQDGYMLLSYDFDTDTITFIEGI